MYLDENVCSIVTDLNSVSYKYKFSVIIMGSKLNAK